MYDYRGTVTNDETWTETFALETDEEISAWSFECVIADASCVRATATASVDTVEKEVAFTVARTSMESLSADKYTLAARYIDGDGVTVQFIKGSLSVQEGGFTP